MRFKIQDSDIGKCIRFAIDITRNKTDDYYKLRNKYASTEKIIFDHFIGKLAEIAVFSLMTDEGKECTYPNFKIGQSDTGDLKVIKENETIIVHVKCVRYDSPVTDSWLVQTKELENLGDSDYFALCKFYDPNEIEICTMIKADKIKWSKPQNPNLTSKSACYLNDIYV